MSDPSVEISSGNLIGTRLNDYQVLRRLGRGGMADVYVALHQSLDRQVALKVLRRQLASDADYVERFRREARAAAKLNHPNIVQVYEVGRAGDHHYIAQELIDGCNLKEHVEKEGPLTPPEATSVLRSVASALSVAHQAGITHRDIKPENILKSHRGEIKVADFGLARVGGGGDLTQIGLTMGTPRYMSPEQVQGRPVDVRSDLYSLGCTLYFLLTGRPPFDADESLAVAIQHLQETPRPLTETRGKDDVPDWMLAAINRMMAKSPDDRFASASELSELVADESGLGGDTSVSGGTAAATVLLQQAMKAETTARRRRQLRWAIAAAIPLIATVAGAWVAAPRQQQTIARLLRPERVPMKETVEQQYLAAASRNDVAAWLAVSEYFPPADNANNAAYAIKADLQRARLLRRQGREDEARRILRRISEDAAVDKLYRVVALAEWADVTDPNSEEHTFVWAQLRQTYRSLVESRPDVQGALWSIIGTDKMTRLQSA
jgi:eukaryotic-like serine/threonine-protein kinase